MRQMDEGVQLLIILLWVEETWSVVRMKHSCIHCEEGTNLIAFVLSNAHSLIRQLLEN